MKFSDTAYPPPPSGETLLSYISPGLDRGCHQSLCQGGVLSHMSKAVHYDNSFPFPLKDVYLHFAPGEKGHSLSVPRRAVPLVWSQWSSAVSSGFV